MTVDSSRENDCLLSEAEAGNVAELPKPAPQFKRDIIPKGIALSSEDLEQFVDLIVDLNKTAKQLQIEAADPSGFESEDDAKQQADQFMPVEYTYRFSNGDSIQGLNEVRTGSVRVPSDLSSFFVSNGTFTNRAFKSMPRNAIDAFFDFQRPTMAMDLLTVPSNPTVNATAINIYGLNEDWVIAAHSKVQRFLDQRRVLRPAIHGSGIYDYLVYLLFFPVLIWAYTRKGEFGREWLEDRGVFTNVFIAVYALLLAFLAARLVFQYFRWLYPPVEYLRESQIGPNLHRAIATFLGLGIVGSATYDLFASLISAIFG